MFCKNCGKQLPDTAKFCSGCGAPVTPRASQPAPVGESEVQPPVAPVEGISPAPKSPTAPEVPAEPEGSVSAEPPQAPAAPETPAEPEAPSPPEIPVQTEEPTDPVVEVSAPPVQPDPPAAAEDTPAKKSKGRIAAIGLGVAAVAVVAVVLFKLISGMVGGMIGGGKRTPAFAYLNTDNELMYLANLKEKTDALEVTDDVTGSASVQFSTDGKTLYFLDNDQTLYKITASDIKKEERPDRVAKDVRYFTVLKTGSVLYATDGNKGVELNCFTGKDDFRVVRGYDSYHLSEDHKTLYYTEKDEDDGVLTLYKVALKENAEAKELLDGATTIYTDFDADLLVYGEDPIKGNDGGAYAQGEEPDMNSLTVYSCKPGGEPTELLDDVYDISYVKVDGGKVSFYYRTQEREECQLYDLVSDTQQSADAALTAEPLVRPDWYNSFYPDVVYVEDETAYYQTISGESFPVDTSALEESYGIPASELSNFDIRTIAYSDAQDRYNAAMDEYNAKYEDWNAANNRNNIREQLKAERYTQTSYSLYRYTGGDPDPIYTNASGQSFSHFGAGTFLYQKAAGVTDGKVCDISDLNYYGEIYDYLNSGSSDSEWYQNVGGTESVFDLDEGFTISDFYTLSEKEAVLVLSEDGNRRIDAYTVGDTSFTFSSTITDEEFTGLRCHVESEDNAALYFFTNVKEKDYGSVGDLNRYSGGKTEVLAEEVGSTWVLDEGGTIYAITDQGRKGFELSLIQGDKSEAVSDKLDRRVVLFPDSKQVLYTAGGDLYLWNGKEERRIAKDVTYVWANAQESFSTYSPN